MLDVKLNRIQGMGWSGQCSHSDPTWYYNYWDQVPIRVDTDCWWRMPLFAWIYPGCSRYSLRSGRGPKVLLPPRRWWSNSMHVSLKFAIVLFPQPEKLVRALPTHADLITSWARTEATNSIIRIMPCLSLESASVLGDMTSWQSATSQQRVV